MKEDPSPDDVPTVAGRIVGASAPPPFTPTPPFVPAPPPARPVETARPGWKTTEFYVSLAAMLAPQLHPEALPPVWRAALTVGAAAVYTISRLFVKGARRG